MSFARIPWLKRSYQEWFLVLMLALALACICCLIRPSLFSSVDFQLFYKQNFIFLAEAIREFRIPMWNPYIGLGRPFLADIQNAVFYPPIYLVLLGPNAGTFLLIWLHAAWLLLGMRKFGVAVGMRPLVAYGGAVAFFLSGACAGRLGVGQIMFVCGITYIPWLFYFATKLADPTGRDLAGYSGVVAFQLLTGHPQVFWLSVLAQVVFATVRHCALSKATLWRVQLRTIGFFTLVQLWALLLAAVVILPFAQLVTEGNRSSPTPEFVLFGVLYEWVKFFNLVAEAPTDYFPGWEENLFLGFAVVIPGILGLLSVRNRESRALLAVVILATLIAVGAQTPAFKAFYLLLPGFKSFRLHSRASILILFGLASAAGIWLSGNHSRKQAYALMACLTVLTAVLVFVFYPFARTDAPTITRWPIIIRALAAGAGCAVLLAGEKRYLKPLGYSILTVLAIAELGWSTVFYKRLYVFENVMQFSPDYPHRATILNDINRSAQPQCPPLPPRVMVPWTVIPQNDAMVYHFSHCDAYTSLFLNRVWHYVHDLLHLSLPVGLNTFFGVDVYKQSRSAYPHFSVDVGFDFETKTMSVDPNPNPRVFMVSASTNVLNAENAINLLRNGWDIYKVALSEKRLELPESSSGIVRPVRVLSFDPNEITVEVNCEQDGLLVFADAYYPGWKADVDGHTVSAIPVNSWMRGFPVSRGQKTVRVYFRQDYSRVGAVITLLSLATLVWVRFRRPRPTADN
jgi:hypothetical protein